MKTLTLSLFLFISATGMKAQTINQYNAAMQKGLGLIDSASTAEQFTAAANLFERVAAAAPQQWLPQYYAGYCDMLSAVLGKQTNQIKDALYDKAMTYAEKANVLKKDNSEIFVLEGYITFMKMAVAPQERAMAMIPKADELLGKAMALNPENPRAFLVKGQDTFFTPEAFGGGKANAKMLLISATDKYKKDKPLDFEPRWGATRCQELLQQCN
jgi:tetratricopeptide (TPR) repeat protein